MNEDNFVPNLPVAGRLLTFRWAAQTGLAVVCADDDGESRINFVRESSILDDPEMRKLINESNGIFLASRQLQSGVDIRKSIVELSREHRSSISQCVANIIKKSSTTDTNSRDNWINVLDNVDHVWHLCELLHLDFVPGEIVLSKLLEWARIHASDYDIVSEVFAESHTRGLDLRNSRYWEMVIGLLFEGRFDACRALLRLHSDAESTAFREAEMILRTIPLYSVYSGLSVSEFICRWRSWKSAVRSKIDSGLFSSRPDLALLMDLLGSDEPLYAKLKPHCRTWYQMMIASILLTDQTVKIHDLSYHASQCIAHYGGNASLKFLDHALIAVLDSNFGAVVDKLQLTPDGGWCAVHLTNLLYLSGVLDSPSGRGVDLDGMLLEYGQLLMSNSSFWQVGTTYLEYCRSGGMEAISVGLTDLSLTSEDIALRVIDTARDYGLDEVVRSVCRIMGHRLLDQNNMAGALGWALISADSEMVGAVADRYLKCYARGTTEMELRCGQVLKNLGQSIFINPRLTFLAKYCDFHSLYENGKLKECSELLIRLLESKVSPKFFWLALLIDALPLLELVDGKSLLSADDTTIVLACLEELTMDYKGDSEALTKFNQKTQPLRLAIAKNFAASILCNSVEPPRVMKCE